MNATSFVLLVMVLAFAIGFFVAAIIWAISWAMQPKDESNSFSGLMKTFLSIFKSKTKDAPEPIIEKKIE